MKRSTVMWLLTLSLLAFWGLVGRILWEFAHSSVG